jgi:hypothetical protein
MFRQFRKLLFCVIVFTVGLVLFGNHKASAATASDIRSGGTPGIACSNYDQWARWDITSNALAGLIVSAEIVDTSGNHIAWVNTDFRVDDVTPAHGLPYYVAPNGTVGDVVNWSNNDRHMTGQQFTTNQGVNCGGPITQFDGETALGAGDSTNYGIGWALQCRRPNPTEFNWFRISINGGVPAGGNSAGHWEYQWEGYGQRSGNVAGNPDIANNPQWGDTSDVNGQYLFNGTRHRLYFRWVQPATNANLRFEVNGYSGSIQVNSTRWVGGCTNSFFITSGTVCSSGTGLPIGSTSSPYLDISFTLPAGYTLSSINYGPPGAGISGTCINGGPPQCTNIFIQAGYSATITLNFGTINTTPCPTFTSPQSVNLSAQNPPKDDSIPGYGPSGETVGYTYAASDNYSIDNVTDQYGQIGDWSRKGKSTNPFSIIYDNYIRDYPYDQHNVTISYQTYYNRTAYVASGEAVYNDWDECTGGYAGKDTNGDGIDDEFSCKGWTKHHDLLGYAVQKGGTDPDYTSTSGSTTAPTMPPCWDRNFNLSPSSGNITWNPSEENPTSVTFSSYINYAFDTRYDGGIGVRESLKVRTNVTADFYIKRGGSIWRHLPINGRCATSGPQQFPDNSNTTSVLIDSGVLARQATGTYIDTDCFNVSVPPLQMGDQACYTFSINPSAGDMRPDGTPTNVTGGLISVPETCAPTTPVQNRPYIRAYTNDIMAGGGVEGGTCSNLGGIYGFITDSRRGSTTQLAAFALNVIDQFGSSQMRNNPYGTGLTFANQPTLGNFGGTQCMPDFYATKPASTVDSGSTFAINNAAPASLKKQAYVHSGNVTITGGNINPFERYAYYIDGNVQITGDIQFVGNYDLKKVPTLYIIATGNIYISPNVTRLDGIYVAQNGTIYTCDTDNAASAGELFANCTGAARQLTVNGALLANRLNSQRAFGSLRHSTATEIPGGVSHACDITDSNYPWIIAVSRPVCASEIINFDPLFYLSLPPFKTDASQRYDAITSLPPVL